jgi:hypothetical protein
MGRGRPPIGDEAMSSAERQRRFLDCIRGTGAAEAKCAKLEAECAKLIVVPFQLLPFIISLTVVLPIA